MMPDMTGLFRPEDTTECAREALREQIVLPILEKLEGTIVEVSQTPVVGVRFSYYENFNAYRQALTTSVESSDAVSNGRGTVGAAVWLFGSERVENPAAVYRALSEVVGEGGLIIAASEVPWPGKILSSEEWAEYTAEETRASFVRSGFCDIDPLVEGPFFRIWKARKTSGTAHIALLNAEDCLSRGDFASAEQILGEITAQMDSAQAVGEFALLVAACHDLGGRQSACLDALSEALLLDPRCARAMCGLGRIAALTGDLDSASDFFDAALRCEPALVAALHGKAVVHESKGDLSGAFDAMMVASDLRPKNDKLLSEASRLGNAVGKLDDVARFIAHRFSHPLQLKSESSDLDDNAGLVARN